MLSFFQIGLRRKLKKSFVQFSFFAKNSHFQIVCANQHFVESLGFTKEAELIGKEDFDIFPQRLAENFRRDDEAVLKTGQARLNIVELFFNPQGIPDWFITHKMPMHDQRGRVIGIMGTTQSYGQAVQNVHPYLHIDRALAYIREHFKQRISIEELAEVINASIDELKEHLENLTHYAKNACEAFNDKGDIHASIEELEEAINAIR